ncbi:hydroxymethylglutaryl-CoA lyase [Neorhizobium sp. DT-125]|uniref:hydroxymethylglutaryl-CoA lyase n=1 Tax=Neorhizobium sp. DT-125 TaxID=3396163 RepID=UPI003F1A5F83
MTALPSAVLISEEGPREGFQIEPGPISTAAKIELIDALSRTGLKSIQVASFVDPRRVPGMADAEEIVTGITMKPRVEYTSIWFNERGLQRALASQGLTITGKIRSYPSKAFLKRNLNRTPEEHLAHTHQEIARYKELGILVTEASVTAAFGCNFQGDISVKTVLEEVDWIQSLAREYELPIEMLSLADTMAWGTPASIRRLVGEVQDRHPGLPVSLHLHDTRGLGIANAYAGLTMGVTMFDTSIAGLGGCPFAAHKGAAGNVCTEDFAFMCEEMGIRTGLDLDALIEAARLAERVVGHPLPGCVMRGGTLSGLRAAL